MPPLLLPPPLGEADGVRWLHALPLPARGRVGHVTGRVSQARRLTSPVHMPMNSLLPCLLLLQVDVSVMSQTVSVKHDASRASPAALVAALNGAMLDASLTPPRRQAQVRLGCCCCCWQAAGVMLLGGWMPADCSVRTRCSCGIHAKGLMPHCE